MKPRSKIMFNIFTLSALLVSLLGSAVFVPSVQAELLAAPLYASGDFLWAKRMGGGSDDDGTSVAVDSSGNVYTTGWFIGTADFDPGVGTADLTAAGLADVFVSKLDRNGNFVWAKGMGGAGTDAGSSITVDSNGSVYTTGNYAGLSDFDPGPGVADLTATGLADVFVSKLDSNGNFVWAKSMGGEIYDRGAGIAVDSSGNIYTTGAFTTGSYVLNADFDPGPDTAYLTSAGQQDIFISKLDSNGNYVWAKSMGGTDYDYANGISVDSRKCLYNRDFAKPLNLILAQARST
ncbi:MAG: SBBP repeat-containing protein [Anaerolineales bacterium]|nr:SBBP repeat-containing protein [Anaerolineales bacterium]